MWKNEHCCGSSEQSKSLPDYNTSVNKIGQRIKRRLDTHFVVQDTVTSMKLKRGINFKKAVGGPKSSWMRTMNDEITVSVTSAVAKV